MVGVVVRVVVDVVSIAWGGEVFRGGLVQTRCPGSAIRSVMMLLPNGAATSIAVIALMALGRSKFKTINKKIHSCCEVVKFI